MLVQEIIQPLVRFFATVAADANTPAVSIANAQAVRVVAHTGAVTGTGTATLRVLVNNINDTTGAVQVPGKSAPLAANSSYEIFVSGAEAYAAIERALILFARVEITGSATVPISIEISAFPGRDIPAPLPANWTRIL